MAGGVIVYQDELIKAQLSSSRAAQHFLLRLVYIYFARVRVVRSGMIFVLSCVIHKFTL